MAEELDVQFQEAVDALRQGDQARAKDVLTRLLQADQNNAAYWVWMSAAVDTAKERVYCLQTALKLDPENGTAKRGLILLGALTPDENTKPFPLNRPRAWEEKLLLAHERPKETGLRAVTGNPVLRLTGVLIIGLVVIGVVIFGLTTPRSIAVFRPAITNTPGPSPTFTLTPTLIGAKAPPTKRSAGPTPLAVLLGVSYTPTPLYVNTPRSPLSQDMYSAAKVAYAKGDWGTYIAVMKQIAQAEPQSADVLYYLGEAYRFQGDCRTALEYYNNSLKIDNNFAPGYLGLARSRLCIEPGADTTPLYDLALQADPNYGEVYLDRANFFLARKDLKAVLSDLDKAGALMPDSALVQLAYASAYLLQGDNQKALAAAQKANSIDLTLLPSYFYLGKTLIADGQYAQAIKPLETYLIYESEDGSAYALLGQAYAETGAYQAAADALRTALGLDATQRQAWVYLATSDLKLGNLADAEYDFGRAIQYYPDSFDANIGLTEIYYKEEKFGSAYLQAETSKSKAANDTQLALAIYWRALSQVKRGAIGDAIKDFKSLLAMPADATTPQMRQDAENYLKTLATPTRTPKGGIPTATPSKTPTPTKKP